MRGRMLRALVALGIALSAALGLGVAPAAADSYVYTGGHCTYHGYTFNADVQRIIHSSPNGTVDFGMNDVYTPFYNDVTVWVVWDGLTRFNSPIYESGIGSRSYLWPETGSYNFTYRDNAYVKWTFSDGSTSCSIWINASGGVSVANGPA